MCQSYKVRDWLLSHSSNLAYVNKPAIFPAGTHITLNIMRIRHSLHEDQVPLDIAENKFWMLLIDREVCALEVYGRVHSIENLCATFNLLRVFILQISIRGRG